MGEFNGKWGVVTLHPWLPSKATQVAAARAWGVSESTLDGADVSARFYDDVRKVARTTRWQNKMPERSKFLEHLSQIAEPGQEVFFANALCVGLSPDVARWTVEAVFAAGLLIYVDAGRDGRPMWLKPGDKMDDFYKLVKAAANAAHQADNRKRKRKPAKAKV